VLEVFRQEIRTACAPGEYPDDPVCCVGLPQRGLVADAILIVSKETEWSRRDDGKECAVMSSCCLSGTFCGCSAGGT
jgi:hypothetical protein